MDSKFPQKSSMESIARRYVALSFPQMLMLGWYVDRETGRNHLIYPNFMTHYWMRTVFPRFRNFEIVGGNGWLGFYFGLVRGKVRRNKWTVALLVAVLGWYTTRSLSPKV